MYMENVHPTNWHDMLLRRIADVVLISFLKTFLKTEEAYHEVKSLNLRSISFTFWRLECWTLIVGGDIDLDWRGSFAAVTDSDGTSANTNLPDRPVMTLPFPNIEQGYSL